ncbi:MAG: dihydrofolate reductase family protein [Chthoniobacterales bacterium]
MNLPPVEARITLTLDGRLALTQEPLETTRRWRRRDALLTQKRGDRIPVGPLVVLRKRGSAIRPVLENLARTHRIRRVICGGEPALLKALVEKELLSVVHVLFTPVIAGGTRRPTLLGPAANSLLPHSVSLKLERFSTAGGQARATFRVLRAKN